MGSIPITRSRIFCGSSRVCGAGDLEILSSDGGDDCSGVRSFPDHAVMTTRLKLQSPDAPPDLSHVETWVFDLDNTLYHPSACDLLPSMDRRINEYLCTALKLDPDGANALRQRLWGSYGTTLRGLMELHAIRPDEFLDFVHDIDLSSLTPNPDLDAALARLPGRKIIFTNATEKHALAVMDRLGVTRHFEGIYDVNAAAYVPKPQAAIYDAFLKRFDVRPQAAAMFEDMACNLAPAAALGMTTIWIRTERPNAQVGSDSDYVHYVVEDLAPWLGTVGIAEAVAAVAEEAVADQGGAPT